MSCVVVTNHAKDRTRQRVRLNKKATERNSERAFLDGLKHSELNGGLKKFVDSLYFKYRTANNIRIYCGNVYLFCGNVLVTVIELPQKFRKRAEDLRRKRSQVSVAN